MGTKKGRIYGKGAPQRFGGGSCPKPPPNLDPPLPWNHGKTPPSKASDSLRLRNSDEKLVIVNECLSLMFYGRRIPLDPKS